MVYNYVRNLHFNINNKNMMIGTIAAIAAAGFFNAIMDNIGSYDTFGKFFKRKNMPLLEEWSEKASWDNKYEIAAWVNKVTGIPIKYTTMISKQFLVMVSDAWHFFKVVMILMFALAANYYVPNTPLVDFIDQKWNWLLIWLEFSISFTIFYEAFQFINPKQK